MRKKAARIDAIVGGVKTESPAMSRRIVRHIRNVIVTYVSLALGGLPFTANMAVAEPNPAVLASAKELGDQIKDGVKPSYNATSGQISVPEGDVMILDGAGADMSTKSSTYGDASALGGVISGRALHLQTEMSDQGNAYRTLRSGAVFPHPDLSHDVIVTSSESAYKNAFKDPLVGGACTHAVNATATAPLKAHIEDLQTCARAKSLAASCKVKRNSVGSMKPIEIVAGDGGSKYESATQFLMTVGKEGDDYYAGSCAIFEQYQTIKINDPSRIHSAVLEDLEYDDHIQVYLNGTLLHTGPHGPGQFPPEIGSETCELSTHWVETLNMDLTSAFRDVAPGTQITFKIRVSVGGKGEGYGRIRVGLNPPPSNMIDQDPPGCLDAINGNPDLLGEGGNVTLTASVLDQASNDYWRCTDAATSRVISTGVGSFTVTQNDYPAMGPLYPGEPDVPPAPICFAAEVRSLGVYQNDCYVDGNGKTQCPTADYTGGTFDGCTDLASNHACHFKKSDCDPSTLNPITGICDTYIDTYDCGTDQDIVGTQTSDTFSCPGDLACMGTDCIDGYGTESNKSFSKVATTAEIMKNVNEDADCASDPTTCRIFTGKESTCVNILSGLQNCCNSKAPTPSLADYMKLTQTSYAMAKDTELGKDLMQQGAGLWNSAKESATSMAQEISQPFVSAYDSFVSAYSGAGSAAAGATASATEAATAVSSAATEAASWGVQQAIQGVTQSAVEWANQAIGGNLLLGADSSLFTIAQDGIGVALNTSGSMIASAISVIGWIYMAYQITNILVQIIWPCTEDEFKLESNKQLKMCHFIGSKSKKALGVTVSVTQKYCCFNSPLARIIHEQARMQSSVNKPWGGYSDADCSGFTMDEFEQIDFGLVDLTEWIAMLQLGGKMPTDPTSLTERYSASNVGTRVNANGSYSANTFDRTKALINGSTGGEEDALDQRREDLRNKAWEAGTP